MRRKLQAKLNSKKGFTLVELLIVVAIIAILVAVSIPMVTGALDRARIATDQANERAARGAATVEYLTGADYQNAADAQFYYDAESGKLVDQATDVTTPYGQCSKHKDGILRVSIDAENGEVTVQWTNAEGTPFGEGKGNPHGIDG